MLEHIQFYNKTFCNGALDDKKIKDNLQLLEEVKDELKEFLSGIDWKEKDENIESVTFDELNKGIVGIYIITDIQEDMAVVFAPEKSKGTVRNAKRIVHEILWEKISVILVDKFDKLMKEKIQ